MSLENFAYSNMELGDKKDNDGDKMNRSEILFLYDIQDGNPNGDPLADNKPRVDEETNVNIVTDVRLKRTIRDYLSDYHGEDIFIRETEYIDKGEAYIKTSKRRALDYSNKEVYDSLDDAKKDIGCNILDNCVDVRLFGATIPFVVKVKKSKTSAKKSKTSSSVNFIGPVQFKNARSLNKVNPVLFKCTGAFASSDGKTTKTFREEYNLPYSLINFYGIINENAAKSTGLANDDVDLLMDAIWNGTKNLISRSKIGQLPRLLLRVEYCEECFHIGDLNNMIHIIPNVEDECIRSTRDFKIGLDVLLNKLLKNKDKIKCVYYKVDDFVTFEKYGNINNVVEYLEENGVKTQDLDCIK